MAQFVIALVVLTCVGILRNACGLPLNKQQIRRNKRHVGETSVQSVLQSFISRLDSMQRLIKQQKRMFARQDHEIKDLKWYVRRKGTQERLEEVKRDIEHQTILLKNAVNIKPLKQYKNSVDNFGKRHYALSAAVKERKKIIDDIYSIIVFEDSKIVCRDVFTSWNKQADYKIGSLDKHHIECNESELLQQFVLQRKDGGLDSPVRYKYHCCRFNVKDKWQGKRKKKNQQ